MNWFRKYWGRVTVGLATTITIVGLVTAVLTLDDRMAKSEDVIAVETRVSKKVEKVELHIANSLDSIQRSLESTNRRIQVMSVSQDLRGFKKQRVNLKMMKPKTSEELHAKDEMLNDVDYEIKTLEQELRILMEK